MARAGGVIKKPALQSATLGAGHIVPRPENGESFAFTVLHPIQFRRRPQTPIKRLRDFPFVP